MSFDQMKPVGGASLNGLETGTSARVTTVLSSRGVSEQPTTMSSLSASSDCFCLRNVWDFLSSCFRSCLVFFMRLFSQTNADPALNRLFETAKGFIDLHITQELLYSGFSRAAMVVKLENRVIGFYSVPIIQNKLPNFDETFIRGIKKALGEQICSALRNNLITSESEFSMFLLACNQIDGNRWRYSLYLDQSRGDGTSLYTLEILKHQTTSLSQLIHSKCDPIVSQKLIAFFQSYT